nr:MAG TPA: single-stranded DNA-binding protein [Caudoviricetes sp.]
MGFWNLSDGKAVESKSEFELGGGFEVIPDGSRVLAAVEECKDDQWEGERFFNLKWRILDGEYKNRIIFQKLKVFSSKEKQRDNAITMLAAIDANAGGKLMASGKEPTDFAIASALANRPMILLLRVWESEDKQKTGNYVAGVFSRQQTKAAPAPKQSAQSNEPPMDFSDDVPF